MTIAGAVKHEKNGGKPSYKLRKMKATEYAENIVPKNGKKVIREDGTLFLTESFDDFDFNMRNYDVLREELKTDVSDLKSKLDKRAVEYFSKGFSDQSLSLIGDYLDDKDPIIDEERRLAYNLTTIKMIECEPKSKSKQNYEGLLVLAARNQLGKLHSFKLKAGAEEIETQDVAENIMELMRERKYDALAKGIDRLIERLETEGEYKNDKDSKKLESDVNTLLEIKTKAIPALKDVEGLTNEDFAVIRKYLMGKYSLAKSRHMKDFIDFYNSAVEKVKNEIGEEGGIANIVITGMLDPANLPLSAKEYADNPYIYKGLENAKLRIIDEGLNEYVFAIPKKLNRRIFAQSFAYDMDENCWLEKKITEGKEKRRVLKNPITGEVRDI
ncbi:MAG: hypothetical protein QXU82_01145 [Candidatus Aenigmatarchaeota archaeon]